MNINDYRYPFTPYPSSWYRISLSKDLAIGQVKAARYFGQDLVLFRNEKGEASLVDAFCPHLGAHLGHGGVIKENNLVCPFHGWEFNGKGECTKIPYCSRIPKKSNLNSWPIIEKNGMIFTFYGPVENKDKIEIPRIDEFYQKDWGDLCNLHYPKVKVHIQEVAENALDLAHFNVVHAYYDLPDLLDFKIDGHNFYMKMDSRRKVLGVLDSTDIEITYHGLGFVHSVVNSKPVSVNVILTTTPVDQNHVEINITVRFLKKWDPIRNLIIKTFIPPYIDKDFAKDFPIWENKTYKEIPLLCEGDGPIMKIRNWAKQFYSQGAFL